MNNFIKFMNPQNHESIEGGTLKAITSYNYIEKVTFVKS